MIKLHYSKLSTRIIAVAALLFVFSADQTYAQDADAIARALQDPLATIKMIATDNTINFKTGEPDSVTGYNFQIQPVWAFPFEKFNFIPRAVIPIIGIPAGARFPNLGNQRPPGDGTTWGISDIILQTFFNPKAKGSWKFGIGPQFSLKTRTDSLVAGPGWGAGVGAVVVGGFGDKLSVTLLANHHWGDEGGFSVSTVQPMIFYNLPGAATIHFNNAMTYNTKAPKDEEWSVPLGLGVSKTFMVGSGGHAVDFAFGFYSMVVRPKGSPKSQAKIGITWVIP